MKKSYKYSVLSPFYWNLLGNTLCNHNQKFPFLSECFSENEGSANTLERIQHSSSNLLLSRFIVIYFSTWKIFTTFYHVSQFVFFFFRLRKYHNKKKIELNQSYLYRVYINSLFMKNYCFIRLHCLIYTLLKWDSLDRLIIRKCL